MTTMQLVEQHIIDKADPRWPAIDRACWLSKNLYNAANYMVRQAYIFTSHSTTYPELDRLMKSNPDYCALPRKVSQGVLRQVDHDWQAYFAARAAWENQPEKFQGRPGLPKYKDKVAGRNLLTYTSQAISQRLLKQKGVLHPSGLDIRIKTLQTTPNQVRIVPHKTHYVVEVVYSVPVQPAEPEADGVAAMDIGLNNLAAVTSNQPGFVPLLVNGRPLKAINQRYNKQRARLQSQLEGERHSSRRLEALTHKRHQRVKAYLHLASRRIIDRLVRHHIGTLIIGKNDGWKQNINLGKRTNQSFVSIPHTNFIHMLTYKAQRVGIQVILIDESYTSKCSCLDNEPVGKHEAYAGKRVHRGLFRASDGRHINADVNGSYNILRKVIPDAISNGIRGAVVHPVQLTLYQTVPPVS